MQESARFLLANDIYTTNLWTNLKCTVTRTHHTYHTLIQNLRQNLSIPGKVYDDTIKLSVFIFSLGLRNSFGSSAQRTMWSLVEEINNRMNLLWRSISDQVIVIVRWWTFVRTVYDVHLSVLFASLIVVHGTKNLNNKV